jgi:hypothetical protein
MGYRILSLDGGGTWAILQAMALQNMFGDENGRSILARFDLAVANSGGSIVLGGLAEDRKPSEIIGLFKDPKRRNSIFAPLPPIRSLLSRIPIFPKYSGRKKLAGLRAVFGEFGSTPLRDLPGSRSWPRSRDWPLGPAGAPVGILIVAFDYDALRSRFFRSYALATGATSDEIPLVEAVHASSEAPVSYFDSPAGPASDGRRYWDGAMAAFNNPVMAGIIDVMAGGVAAANVSALSIGTGTTQLAPPGAHAPPDLTQRFERSGIVNDLKKAATSIKDDPPDNASYAAHVILNQARSIPAIRSGPLVRLSPFLRPIHDGKIWSIPAGFTPDAFQRLVALPMDATAQDEVALIVALGEAWIEDRVKNQPIRIGSDDLACRIGDDLYSAGKARWLSGGFRGRADMLGSKAEAEKGGGQPAQNRDAS